MERDRPSSAGRKSGDRDYIERRVIPRLRWYDERAVRAKRQHLMAECIAVGGSLALPFMLHLDDVPHLLLAVVASLVSVAVAVERIGRFGERWVMYRLAAETLAGELELYRSQAGPYDIGDGAAKLLVERVEAVLVREADRWHGVVEARRPHNVLSE